MASAVAGSNFITAGEMDRLIRLMGERRDVSLLVVPPAEADTADVSDAEVQAWYTAHESDYRAPESVAIEYIELDASSMPAPPAVDRSEETTSELQSLMRLSYAVFCLK